MRSLCSGNIIRLDSQSRLYPDVNLFTRGFAIAVRHPLLMSGLLLLSGPFPMSLSCCLAFSCDPLLTKLTMLIGEKIRVLEIQRNGHTLFAPERGKNHPEEANRNAGPKRNRRARPTAPVSSATPARPCRSRPSFVVAADLARPVLRLPGLGQRGGPDDRSVAVLVLDPVRRPFEGAVLLPVVEQQKLVLTVVLQAGHRDADLPHRQAVPMPVEQLAREPVGVVRRLGRIRQRHLPEKPGRPVEIGALAADGERPPHLPLGPHAPAYQLAQLEQYL